MGNINTDYPWTFRPLIANAPMAGFAGPRLATAVTAGGGLGFIGSADDMELLSEKLDEAVSTLASLEIKTAGTTLPLGVGFLLFAAKLESASAVIAKHRPAAVFLSCPRETQDLATWANAMRVASPESRVWIQVASVTAAVDVARLCAPDVLVLQAADAGGHGGLPGAGLITLVPETRDALDAAGLDIPVVGAGGIGDGRGVAAALACGAEGVLLGTAFLVSHEVDLPVKEYQDSILRASDGGNSTVRAIVFDELKGPNIWPAGYDGRALVNASFKDHLNGMKVDELRKKHAEAAQRPDKGYGDEQRAAVWAGSGVGLLTEVKAAKDIVQELREGAKNTLHKVARSF